MKVDQLSHSCSLCKSPFPFICEHCLQAQSPYALESMAAEAIAKVQEIVPVKKKFIGSGEDAFADLYVN